MDVNLCQVDVFTDIPFQGNPVGVVPDARNLSDKDMRLIARELNLSETVFVTPISHDDFKLRFFTPEREVELCGHGTIGAFYTLAMKGYLRSKIQGVKTVYQRTKIGKLKTDIYFENEDIDKITMELGKSSFVSKISDEDLYEGARILGLEKNNIGIGEDFLYPEIIKSGLKDLIVPIRKKEVLDNLNINFNQLREFSNKLDISGLHAFHMPKKDSEAVYARNFAPAVGINEESGTGTASGSMAFYLKRNGFLTKSNLLSYQGEALERLSKINISIMDDDNVEISGKSVLILDCILKVKKKY